MTGLVTEVERFALNDGPGIRTTVFLKGCNMKCKWCHNPETISRSRDILYYANKCISCYKCVYVCPSKAQKKISGLHHYYPNLCVKCGKCADICYAGAMAISGKKMSTEEVMAEIVQDRLYYKTSGGGVTISGGEVFCQREFAESLVDACHSEGITVGVETNLHFDWEEISPLLSKLDLVMCDLKLYDEAEHIRWTGVTNEKIKSNIRKIAESGKPFIVRTPIIPGATDSDENIRNIAGFLRDANVNGTLLCYELLNFNPLGATKYKSMKKRYEFEQAKPLSEARMAALRELAASAGIKVKAE